MPTTLQDLLTKAKGKEKANEIGLDSDEPDLEMNDAEGDCDDQSNLKALSKGASQFLMESLSLF